MEQEPFTHGIAVANAGTDDPGIHVVADDESGSQATVDELEARLEVIESAMEQLQAGDVAAAEESLVLLDIDKS